MRYLIALTDGRTISTSNEHLELSQGTASAMTRLVGAILSFVLLLCASGCLVNRTRSTIDDSQTAYAMTRDQAREIVKSSIAAFISPDYVNQTAVDSLTASGYIRAGIDTQTINVTAIPATGRNADSGSKSGYGFLLNDRGTIGYDPTPDEIWKYVLKRANQVGKPFRVAGGE